MFSDLLEHQILINGTFAKIDVIRYEAKDDESVCELLEREPEYQAYINRIWVDLSKVTCLYEAENDEHTIIYLSDDKYWEARYRRDAIAQVIFDVRDGKYSKKKPGLIARIIRYLF